MIFKQTARVQSVHRDTRWESYRVSIPKSMITALGLAREGTVLLEFVGDGILLSKYEDNQPASEPKPIR